MGWFVGALHGQGRTDLTRSLLVDRRDAFLEAALAALCGTRSARPRDRRHEPVGRLCVLARLWDSAAHSVDRSLD
jgi:hypothetical protein